MADEGLGFYFASAGLLPATGFVWEAPATGLGWEEPVVIPAATDRFYPDPEGCRDPERVPAQRGAADFPESVLYSSPQNL